VEFLPLKVSASCFDLELHFGCAKFDALNWRNLILKIIEITLVIKVSELSFSKLRV
jgi:hypothetical protein